MLLPQPDEYRNPTPHCDVVPADFFVLRTPLLPISEFIEWGQGLQAARSVDGTDFEAAWGQDVKILRNRLSKVLIRPEVADAILLAAPALRSGIEHWQKDPNSKKGLQAERALTRYFSRMCGRPTPFGLFAGCSLGTISESSPESNVILSAIYEYRSYARLDSEYLFGLARILTQNKEIAQYLSYQLNSTLHRIGDSWHYVQARALAARRSHHLVRVENDCFLEAALECARRGAAFSDLVNAVLRADSAGELDRSVAESYITELIANDILQSTLIPNLTGPPALDHLIAQLETVESAANIRDALVAVRQQTTQLKGLTIGAVSAGLAVIEEALKRLPADVDQEHFFQVDLVKPLSHKTLGKAAVDELIHAAMVLSRLHRAGEDAFESFREAFLRRYDRRRVPLVEALDAEAGIGFGPPLLDGSPLTHGLKVPSSSSFQRFDEFHALLLRKLTAKASEEGGVVDLDIAELPGKDSVSLPNSFSLDVTLIGNADDIMRGDFQIYLRNGIGPGGARLWARFCHADPDIEACLKRYLQMEGLHNPDAIYAEIVHLPEERLGNVLARPVLRDYEIVYLGVSGAPPERRIPVTDLLIGIEDGQIELYSQHLSRRVIPRLTTAHNFENEKLDPLYRFLCYLQHQNRDGLAQFAWGPLSCLSFLPRVKVGRVILAAAQWHFSADDIKALSSVQGSQLFRAVQALRTRIGLPRWVALEEFDRTLPTDLENALSVDAFVHVLKRRTSATLREMLPEPQAQQWIGGPEGSYCHELQVPFIRRPQQHSQERAGSSRHRLTNTSISRDKRSFAPLSEWLFVKVYAGAATLDNLLVKTLTRILRDPEAKSIASWFFVRYFDPDGHLRIRFRSTDEAVVSAVLRLVTRNLEPLLHSGEIWKVQIDTYEREVERYGGLQGVIAAEEIFCADSEAVLNILGTLQGDQGLDLRWRGALLGIDMLLNDFGMDLEKKRTFLKPWYNDAVKRQLDDFFRRERTRIEDLLRVPGDIFPSAKSAFDGRSAAIADPIRRLRILEKTHPYSIDLVDLCRSVVHMHVNRIIRSSAVLHERALYNLLFRIYDGKSARERAIASA